MSGGLVSDSLPRDATAWMAPVPSYSDAERERRWSVTRAFMEREGLDALIVFGEHEDAGPAPFCFDTWLTNDCPGATVVFPRDGQPTALVPVLTFLEDKHEAVRRGDDVWIPPEHSRVGSDASKLADALEELGLARATVGVVGLDPYRPFLQEGLVPYRLWRTVKERCPGADFRPVGRAFALLTAVLSDEELAVVRHSAAIGDEMVRAMVRAARAGVLESEVYAAGIAAALARGTVVPGMHFWSGPTPLGFGPPQWAYRPQAPRVLEDGDTIKAEVYCNFGMRMTQHQAAIAIGPVHEDFQRAADVARASYDAGLQALRPNRAFCELAAEMRAPIEAVGGVMPQPLVHTLNPITAVGGGATTSSPTLVLEPGMTFAFEPRCCFGRRAVTVGGTVILGEDGAIELNPYTAQLLRGGTDDGPS